MTDNLFVAPDVCAPMVMYRNYAWHRPFEIIGNQHPSWNVIGRGRGNVDSFEQESVTPFPAYDFGGKRFWLGIVAQILAENRSSQFLPFLQASPSRSQERQTADRVPAAQDLGGVGRRPGICELAGEPRARADDGIDRKTPAPAATNSSRLPMPPALLLIYLSPLNAEKLCHRPGGPPPQPSGAQTSIDAPTTHTR